MAKRRVSHAALSIAIGPSISGFSQPVIAVDPLPLGLAAGAGAGAVGARWATVGVGAGTELGCGDVAGGWELQATSIPPIRNRIVLTAEP